MLSVLLLIKNAFLKSFVEKLAEATRKYANLKSELYEAQDGNFDSRKNFSKRHNLLRKRTLTAKKMQELKLAFSEFYLSLILLQNYQNLNFTGFRKILKKHDKVNMTQRYYLLYFKTISSCFRRIVAQNGGKTT